MIRISETLYWDETLNFIGQSVEVQTFINNKMNSEICDETQNETCVYPRPLNYIWYDKSYDYVLTKTFVYKYESTNPEAGIISDYIITVVDNSWFEPNNKYQVKQKYDDCFIMLENVPELGMYRKAHDIITYKRNGMIYFYVRYFDPGYVEILEAYSCVITENKNYIEEVI